MTGLVLLLLACAVFLALRSIAHQGSSSCCGSRCGCHCDSCNRCSAQSNHEESQSMVGDGKDPLSLEIRKATKEEMLTLWSYRNYEDASPTARFFYDNLSSDNAEFWAMADGGKLIGELYVFRDLLDKDFADGRTKAYLCSFRIEEAYRGRGFGSRLMQSVLLYLKSRGLQTITIGVEESEIANLRLYHRFGFQTKVKDCFIDPCALDDEMKPKGCPCFWLLSKVL